eukprot:Skav211140  [mRNA]  locus=scaffold4091:176975:183538:- [translate_table: standard]
MEPNFTMASWASMVETWKASPGTRKPRSVAIQPTVANIATRPCFSSASRSQRMSILGCPPKQVTWGGKALLRSSCSPWLRLASEPWRLECLQPCRAIARQSWTAPWQRRAKESRCQSGSPA